MDIKIKFHWQLNQDGETHNIDTVLFQMLEAVQTEGSLKKATDRVRVSYRFAWGLLGKWESILGQPLVILERGRGARLSAAGEKLMHAHRHLSASFSPELDNFATQFKREFETVLEHSDGDRFNIFASHGLAVGALRDLINQQSGFKLDLHFHGSLESLRALRNGECHIAGFHIPVGDLGHQLSPNYLKILSPDSHQLIYVVKRNQGLMVAKDNPKQIDELHALTRDDVTFINRQADSGTRLLLDQLLDKNQIAVNRIKGYSHEEFTHMAVAAMVASGAADAGFGIAPIADKFNLEFIPLVWEHYCLALPRDLAEDERVAEIISLLQSDAFQQKLACLSGYDFSRSGELVSFKEIFA
ncbi:substrate-binding domain-containing protein [Methylophaga sp. OBS4]|uniref:substrate-binding domain-containing protein n=1 Tax=Methylophaga sp. OBS4 TaxID=2991935 RepID=UPI002258F6DA|nr:substrate-binding domain-containing protein [Methylophaga sp. OBS4]MCX4187465.1 helix-turn-helix transcriptional regulator [Methylophaga sp. OBS4]